MLGEQSHVPFDQLLHDNTDLAARHVTGDPRARQHRQTMQLRTNCTKRCADAASIPRVRNQATADVARSSAHSPAASNTPTASVSFAE